MNYAYILIVLCSLMSLSACKNSCKNVGCLNGGVCNKGDCICPTGFSGEHCEIVDSIHYSAEIKCGTDWNSTCLNDNWTIVTPDSASITILPEFYMGKNCLKLINPHEPTKANPAPIVMKSILKNIKNGVGYKVSCEVKIQGYPDYVTNPSFAYYAFSNDNWYGEKYYGTTGGEYHDLDWTTMSYNFIGGDESTLQFEVVSIYDTVWIADFKITEL